MEEGGKDRVISYQDSRNAALYEPRIVYIIKLLENILSQVELTDGGRVVEVDGFRLKNLKDWLVTSSCDPVEIFGYAGSRCNIRCAFCYNRGNPPSFALGSLHRPPEDEYHEMMTRLRYFNPRAGLSLYPSLGDIYEVLEHPYILNVLRPLRASSDKPFRIGTNGAALTPEFIEKLVELKPVYLYISVNSVADAEEFKTMGDGTLRIPVSVLRKLREAGIPYAVVVVPWPVKRSLHEVLDSLAETMDLAQSCDAHLVEINLPGHTRCFSERLLFDLDEVWSAAVARVRELRDKYRTPMVAMPAMYEENLYEPVKNLPSVMGLVENSPAGRAGIRRGDVIVRIDGIRIISRPQARDLLSMVKDKGKGQVPITVDREGEELVIPVDIGCHAYPYSPEIDQHLGIVFLGTGLRLGYIEALKNLIDERGARRVLFLSSVLVKPVFRQLLSESPLFAGSEISLDIEVPANNLLGGNIFMGDLLTVQDFIDAIKKYVREADGRPDLVVIPSSPFNLGAWGRDLTGKCYLEIERAVDIPVALLRCMTIYD
jgi:uncharacterized Fe-S cluster-containing radical SAM superfamily protein